MPGVGIITEACIDVKDRARVDVCPVQCIYEFDPENNILFSEVEAGDGLIENRHVPVQTSIDEFRDSMLYVNTDECTSCTACYQPDVCPVGAIYAEEHGSARRAYNSADANKGQVAADDESDVNRRADTEQERSPQQGPDLDPKGGTSRRRACGGAGVSAGGCAAP